MIQPHTLHQALQALASPGHMPLAGGTDLYAAAVGKPLPGPLVYLARLPELRGIEARDGGTWFGAATTWSELIAAPLSPRFDALKQAAREVGGAQVQNAGTLGGNLCNASPAADGTPVWLALQAQVELASLAGQRRLPLAQFVLGPRRVTLQPGELVRGLWVPPMSEHATQARSAFSKLGSRRYLVIAISSVAAHLALNAQGQVLDAGVAVGSCSAVPQRLPALEAALRGLSPQALAAVEVQPQHLAPLSPIDDVRASAAYRLDATRHLLQRLLRGLAA